MLTALRDSVRAWRRSPVVATIAALSLALGIGAVTTFFAIVDRLLLRTLDVPEPYQLAMLADEASPRLSRVTFPVWEQVRARTNLYDRAFAWASYSVNLAPQGEVDTAQAVWASGQTFETLRVEAARGRLFDQRDDVRGGGPDGFVAVISHAFWLRRFAGAPDVIGRTITVERVPFTIIGVAPRSLPGLAIGWDYDLVLPLMSEPRVHADFSFVDTGRTAFLRVVMRLRGDRPAAAVAAALRTDQSAIRDATIAPFRRPSDREAFLRSPFVVTLAPGGASGVASYYGQSATIALGLGTLLLIACCGNVATVLLAHGARRRHELSVRVALGASRWESGRRLLADSVVLSATGAVAGLALAQWAGPWLVAQWDNSGLDSAMKSGTDWRVWGFSSAIGVLTGVLCGLAAAFRATRVEPAEALKSRGPRQSSPEGAQRWLVVAQVAFSVVVMVTSGLLLRSYLGVMATPALSHLEGVTVAELRLAKSNIAPADRAQIVERARAAAVAVPGVVAGLAMTAPFYGGAYFWAFEPIDRAGLGTADRMAMVNAVSRSYFEVVGLEMLSGRPFDGRDVTGAPRVGVANRTFARKYLGGETRIPQRVRFGTGKDLREIEVVGVAEDQPDAALLQPSEPTLYLARDQDVVEDGVVLLAFRRSGGAAVAPEAVSAAIAAALPHASVRFVSLAQTARSEFTRERMLAIVAAFFVAMATLIAALGVFGVVSFGVAARRRELGIRLALGALPRQVGALILGSAGRLLLAGIALGLLASWWATSFVSSLLVNTDAHHAGVFVAAAGCLVTLGLMAAWWPARQASRLDPAEVLRAE